MRIGIGMALGLCFIVIATSLSQHQVRIVTLVVRWQNLTFLVLVAFDDHRRHG